MLLRAAARAGVTVLQPAEVLKITRHGELFNLDCRTEEGGRSLSGSWVIGAYGKGAAPDQEESRHVAGRRTGFNGVKFHIPERLLGTILPDEILIAPGRGCIAASTWSVVARRPSVFWSGDRRTTLPRACAYKIS